MSYRAFKRLLGETSLERKCRFLFGAFILVLITGSFWLYARQTEHLAYDQINTTCRLLAQPIVVLEYGGPADKVKGHKKPASQPFAIGRDLPASYKYRFITPNATRAEDKH